MTMTFKTGLSRETIKKNQMKILQLKSTITEMKKNYQMGSIADLRQQKKESVNFQINQ